MPFDQLHEASEDDIECGAGRNHLEHVLLPGAEVGRLPLFSDVAGDGKKLHDHSVVVRNRRDDDVPPLICTAGGPAESFERSAFAGHGACDCGTCGRLVFTLPEIHPDPADQIVGAIQIEQFNAGRVQVDDAAVEVDELDAIGAPLDQVAPE